MIPWAPISLTEASPKEPRFLNMSLPEIHIHTNLVGSLYWWVHIKSIVYSEILISLMAIATFDPTWDPWHAGHNDFPHVLHL